MTEHQYTPRVWKDQFAKALILERPHATLDGYLRSIGIEPDRRDEAPKDEDELIGWLQEGGHNLIFKRSRIPITRRVIEASPNLMGIQLCCIGDDSIDKEAAARNGVLVMNDPVSNGRSVVEMVLGELIVMSRRIFEAEQDMLQHRWTKSNKARYELLGKTLGVIGLGNIGKQVASTAEAFGMKIVFYDNREVAQEVGETLGWTQLGSIKDVFARSHAVTVHVSAEDYRGQTNEGMITREMFLAMGSEQEVPGPRLFVNAARGFIYRPEDLIEAVTEGAIHYASVDVFPEEPDGAHQAWKNPYAEVPQIYTTPHIGAATQEAQPRIAKRVARTVRLFNDYGSVRDCVYFPKHPIGLHQGERPKYILSVVHSDTRGTKKAVDETIYDAGLSNLSSVHRDVPKYGIAYDLNALNGPLTDEQIEGLIERAIKASGDAAPVRAIRMIEVPGLRS